MAYTYKPGTAPTLDMAAIGLRLQNNQALTATQTKQLIAWKQWVESSNVYDGASKGGLRDTLDADAKAVDGLKTHTDANSQAILELRADVQALQEAPPARPFP